MDIDAGDEGDGLAAGHHGNDLVVRDDGVDERPGGGVMAADLTRAAGLHDEVDVAIRAEIDVEDARLADEGVRCRAHRRTRRGSTGALEAHDAVSIHIDDVEVSIRADGKGGNP